MKFTLDENRSYPTVPEESRDRLGTPSLSLFYSEMNSLNPPLKDNANWHERFPKPCGQRKEGEGGGRGGGVRVWKGRTDEERTELEVCLAVKESLDHWKTRT